LSAHSPDSLWHLTIRELTIEQSREQYFREDKKVLRPDSTRSAYFRNYTIGEILTEIAPVYINMYGSTGSASGTFLRGANASQSLVHWNGFPLNSVTLGTADLSLLPVGGFNDISVTMSASGAIYSSGAFGGSIDLNNKPDWDKKLDIILSPELGSYGDKRISFSGSGGNRFLQFHTMISRQHASNNFVFSDTYKSGNPEETILNNALNNTIIIQNFFLKLPANNQLEAGFWYQNKVKEIPAIMGSYLPGSAFQSDSTIKFYAKWNKLFRKSSIHIKTAYFNDHMVYRDELSPSGDTYLIDSRIKGSRLMADGFYRIFLGNFISLDTGIGISSYSATVSNYGGKENEFIPAVYTGFKFRRERLTANLSIRKEFHNDIDLMPLISVGIRTEIIPKKLAFRINYSDQFRMPTFNDKYWKPGGNPELLPEKGWSSDAGIELNIHLNNRNSFFFELTAFNTNINNLIQWLPTETGIYWSPENKSNVISMGLETNLNYSFSSGKLKYKMKSAYSYGISKISETNENNLLGQELIYRPNHQARFFSHIESGRYSFSGNLSFTGRRFTTEDNNPVYAMPAFTLINTYLGYRINLRGISGIIQFKINNLFNHQYQVVRSYAMPGRIYQLGIIFNYHINNNK
jgi:vitamin B12 transporter